MSILQHQYTPTLSVVDPRGLPVRGIAYHRVSDGNGVTARISRQMFNANAHLIQQWDPRLLALATSDGSVAPNQQTLFSLNGRPLRSKSVDAGLRVGFCGASGLVVDSWDGRGLHQRQQYDDLLRPEAVFAQLAAGEDEHCVERFTYAGTCEQEAWRNRCGQLIRYDDPAGSLWHEAYAVTGSPLVQTRRFCRTMIPPVWSSVEAEREALLEIEGYTTRWRHDAQGAVVEQTDAVGTVQRFEVDIAGLDCAAYLNDVALLKGASYNASGQVETEHLGNDVLITSRYCAASGELYNLQSRTGAGHLLQDLAYRNDPVGNIESIEDKSQPVQWFDQQRIEAVSRFTYDTLYQLTSASGRENASQTLGPNLPGLEIFGASDDSRWRNYTQTFDYDSGGNLTLLQHDAGAGKTYLREMAVAERSNRSLLKGSSPIDFASGFDRNGNQLTLSSGQTLQWGSRNQLRQVTQVQREEPDGRDDDLETYIYDGSGLRVRKVRRSKTRGGEQISEVRYLPGLEICTRSVGEQLHVSIARAGSNDVRCLHWVNRLPKGLANNQTRYSLGDHLGSSTLELDGAGQLISHESYYPYGGTAWWAARSAVEADKTVRYSGKERDATGLYYYGFRYYAPWLQRWINPDPSGDADGLNVYAMVGNNPVTFFDSNGHEREAAVARWKSAYNQIKRFSAPVNVNTVAPGIISVNITGGNELFARMGIPLTRHVEGDRKLSYLSIDSSYRTKISGGEAPVYLKSNPQGAIGADKKLNKSSTTAYINGGFYNMLQKADAASPTYASIGKNLIDSKEKASVSIPLVHRSDYAKVGMDDGSMIFSGPVLSREGVQTFTSQDLKKGRFQFNSSTDSVGAFGHADQPNPRSGISFPKAGKASARTRVAVGLADSRSLNSPGYVMDEWAGVMARLDRMNVGAPGWAVNLDGGGSSALGVMSQGQSVMAQGSSYNWTRDIGNFIAFYRPKTSRLRSVLNKITGK